jgi:hypothetical protein
MLAARDVGQLKAGAATARDAGLEEGRDQFVGVIRREKMWCQAAPRYIGYLCMSRGYGASSC